MVTLADSAGVVQSPQWFDLEDCRPAWAPGLQRGSYSPAGDSAVREAWGLKVRWERDDGSTTTERYVRFGEDGVRAWIVLWSTVSAANLNDSFSGSQAGDHGFPYIICGIQ